MVIRSGISRERARRRRRFLLRLTFSLAAVGGFIALGYSSYRAGSALAEREVVARRGETQQLKAEVDADRLITERLQADLARSQQATIALQRRYDADVPSGGLAALVTILRQKQGAGIKDDRISRVLREIDVPHPCEGSVARRRLPITTKAQGPGDMVSFLDGLIQISVTMPAGSDAVAKPAGGDALVKPAGGDAVVKAAGSDAVAKPAGSDALAKAAVVTISRAWAAEPIKLTGLPVQQIITINNVELKLVVEASNLRGFVEASLSTCGKM